jgi:hypothetical protein
MEAGRARSARPDPPSDAAGRRAPSSASTHRVRARTRARRRIGLRRSPLSAPRVRARMCDGCGRGCAALSVRRDRNSAAANPLRSEPAPPLPNTPAHWPRCLCRWQPRARQSAGGAGARARTTSYHGGSFAQSPPMAGSESVKRSDPHVPKLEMLQPPRRCSGVARPTGTIRAERPALSLDARAAALQPTSGPVRAPTVGPARAPAGFRAGRNSNERGGWGRAFCGQGGCGVSVSDLVAEKVCFVQPKSFLSERCDFTSNHGLNLNFEFNG